MFKKASIAFMAILNVVKCDIYIHSYDRTDQQKPIEIFKYKLVGIGPEIPVYGIQGEVVSVIPEDGCSKIVSPSIMKKNWFALIKSGNCSFYVKVRNAQNGKFSLAILYESNTNENITWI